MGTFLFRTKMIKKEKEGKKGTPFSSLFRTFSYYFKRYLRLIKMCDKRKFEFIKSVEKTKNKEIRGEEWRN